MQAQIFTFFLLGAAVFGTGVGLPSQALGSHQAQAEALAAKLYEDYRTPKPLSPEEGVHAIAAGPARDGRTPASVITTPWNHHDPFQSTQGSSLGWKSLLAMSALGLVTGLGVAYALFVHPPRSVVQLLIPGTGEHFTIRPGKEDGEYILDVMDVRGNLLRTAGTLRPHSVARAAVLPPELAARLGAKSAFDRFEFTPAGTFEKTDKDEGYQVFPFVLNAATTQKQVF